MAEEKVEHQPLEPGLHELWLLAKSTAPVIDFRDLTHFRAAVRRTMGMNVEDPVGEAKALHTILFRIVEDARSSLIAVSFKDLRTKFVGRPETFLAAAGEHLRLVHPHQDYTGDIVKTMSPEDRRAVESSLDKSSSRKLARDHKAAIWLGSTLRKTGTRNIGKCLNVLTSVFHSWLTEESKVAGIRAQVLAGPNDSTVSASGVDINRVIREEPIGYVRREDLDVEFAAALVAGARVIFVGGQAGMGKTTLARAKVRQELDQPIFPELVFEGPDVMPRNLRAHLLNSGVDVSALSHENFADYLTAWLCSSNAPGVVLMDNFESTDQLYSMLPSAVKPLVVATCRYVGSVVPQHRVIKVSQMTLDQATTLIKQRLPEIGSLDAELAAAELSCYPLAISHACALSISSNTKLLDICRDLSREPHHIPTEGPQVELLSSILTRAVKRLKGDSPLAAELLGCIVFARGAEFEYVIRGYVIARHGPGADLAYARAMDALQRLALISRTRLPDADDGVLGLYLSIHPLTSVILAGLLADHVPVLFEFAAKAAELFWRSADPLAPRPQVWTAYTKGQYLNQAVASIQLNDSRIGEEYSDESEALLRRYGDLVRLEQSFFYTVVKRYSDRGPRGATQSLGV